MVARVCIIATALVAALLCACDDPTPVSTLPATTNEPPFIKSFRPEVTQLDVFIGDNVDFAVAVGDPEGATVTSSFFLGETLVSQTFWWRYAVSGLGPATVRAVISDGVHETEKVWTLERRDATADPIVITHFDRTTVPGEVELRWIAGMDNDGGALTTYRVRTALEPITNNQVWSIASPHADVPVAAAPGEEMTMILKTLPPKAEVFVAVRGVGSLGQFTVLGESPSVQTDPLRLFGNVYDAETGAPLSGVSVRLGSYSTTTDATGAYSLDELSLVSGYLVFSDDDGSGPGMYYDNRRRYIWRYVEKIDVHMLPVHDVESAEYPDFLTMFLHFVRMAVSPEPLGTRRWQLPLDVYVPPRVNGGLDYQAVIVGAMVDLEQVFARDLFNVVSAPPDTGLYFEYSPSITRDIYDILEWTPDGYPARARVQMRTLYVANDSTGFLTVVRHEFGHVLGLMSHSLDTRHLMVGGQAALVTHFTDDERNVLSAYLSFPRGTDLSHIIND